MSAGIVEVAFPKLNDEQMEHARQIGQYVVFDSNEELISQGQKDYPFFIIISGEVRVVEKCGADEKNIATHGPRSFTGDVDMMTGRAAVISAIADGRVEAFKLCAGKLRKLLTTCPLISEMLLEAFQLRRKLLEASDFVGVRLIGNAETRETSRMREFFYKNHVPHTFFEAAEVAGKEQLSCLEAHELPLPVVNCNGQTVGNPSLPRLAECIGISRKVDQELYDLVIVGAGPAGLAASVYAASEAIKTLVIDSVGPGGQAGSSSRIENFIGFPSGLSGSDLANRGYLQALKFGATFTAPITVESIETLSTGEHQLSLCTGQVVKARCVLLTSGVTYQQLDLPGCREFEGAGVYYAATSVEARLCEDSTAVVVGGGNSAGQAAMFLANLAKRVKVVIRGDNLAKSMSAYLCQRVLDHPKIEVVPLSEVSKIEGESSVQQIRIRNRQTGNESIVECGALFIFIGARPNTGWLPNAIQLDEKGFIETGGALIGGDSWLLERSPCELETSVPGIMAAGDARSGTTKRCGFAVGDGALAVACVHRYLSGLT